MRILSASGIITAVVLTFLVACHERLAAQEVTVIVGKVVDAQTREALPFVDLYFPGTTIGSSTDLDGRYRIDTRYATDSLTATFIGYAPVTIAIQKGVRKQTINFELGNQAVVYSGDDIIVRAKKQKYSKKNNPAVDLIRKVMANKSENRIESNEFYNYKKHETVELDINNLTENFTERDIIKSMDFIYDYIDTSEVNGKLYLPLFIKETISDVHYKKEGDTKKEVRQAVKYTEFDGLVEEKSLDGVTDVLYQDIDVYSNNIKILSSQFVSPLAPVGVNFYRYYIMDTLYYKGDSVINLAFIPKNKLNKGFTGSMYITHLDNYFVKKVDLGIIGGISLNFVRDMKIEQEFERLDDQFVLTKDQITVDFSLTENGLGFYGTKDVLYKDYTFKPPNDQWMFSHIDKVIDSKDTYKRSEDYWLSNRFEPLTEDEEEVYAIIKFGLKVFMTGYIPAGPIDIGPVPTFFSFNDVEGNRYKFALETAHQWNKKMRFGGYGAYGTRDDAFKYSVYGTYSFNDDFKANPRHFLYLEHSHDVNFPGVNLDYIKTDNVLLSFRRGRTEKMIFNRLTKLDYTREGGRLFDYTLTARKDNRKPHGKLLLPFLDNNDTPSFLNEINTFELGLSVRYAPNEQFIQGRQYRSPVFTIFPVVTLNYKAGIKALGGDYAYHKLSVNLFKRVDMSLLGHSLVEVEAGKVFGNELPYVLLKMPRANQTYSYQLRSYSMMNFMEFATDQYLELNVQHFFGGFFIHRIPLIKRLKLREVVSLKAIYGRFTDSNNPNLSSNAHLPQFQLNEDGIPETFSLDDKPYIELSAGLYNIFKVFRVDLVKRMTYLDNPELPVLFNKKGLGIRVRFKVDF